jgi:hypothetical protein
MHFYRLLFQGNIEELSLMSHIIPLVERFGRKIRDIRIKFPDLGLENGLSLELEIFVDDFDFDSSDLPHYSPVSHRSERFEDELKDKIPEDIKKNLPKDWPLTMSAMKSIAEMVNNMENSRHHTDLIILGNDEDNPTGDCVLTFGKVNEISYPFLEEICSVQGERLEDIEFLAKSIEERKMSFIVLNDLSKEKRIGRLPERLSNNTSKKKRRIED